LAIAAELVAWRAGTLDKAATKQDE